MNKNVTDKYDNEGFEMCDYDTQFICDLVCRMSLALKSDNKFTDNEKDSLALSITALDPTVGREFLKQRGLTTDTKTLVENFEKESKKENK